MGWADCGTDSKGRPIGYAHVATCDEPGCEGAIDRGLEYACGGMHGPQDLRGNGTCCELYFCAAHRLVGDDGVSRCAKCDAEHAPNEVEVA
jgi:hypothetical protein